MAQYVTVINRTSRDLQGVWDGRTYTIQPGKNSYPLYVAEALKRANPIMGSDDFTTGQLQYLVGIEEHGDPITPIEQSEEIELYNRKLQRNAVPIMVVPGNIGMYSVRRSEMAPVSIPGAPVESTFSKP